MTDKDLKQHVQNALDYEPGIDASDIGVSVDDGVVTLRGNVASYREKIAAERVALRVYGAKAIANDLAAAHPAQFGADAALTAAVAIASHGDIWWMVRLLDHVSRQGLTNLPPGDLQMSFLTERTAGLDDAALASAAVLAACSRLNLPTLQVDLDPLPLSKGSMCRAYLSRCR